MPKSIPVNWEKIKRSENVTAHIAYYYSDPKSEIPVRGVRKNRDNKADPNIETKTYGLFTTCMPPARRNIVKHGNWYIFFFTNRNHQRMFTGYYELDRFVDSGIIPRTKRGPNRFPDYALIAKRTHFVREGVPLVGKIWKPFGIDDVGKDGIDGYGPRDFKQIDTDLALLLKEKLDEQEDITSEYVKEIHRLEEENLKKSGGKYKYPSWERKNGFTTDDFGGFIK